MDNLISNIDTTNMTDEQYKQILDAIRLSREFGYRDGYSDAQNASVIQPNTKFRLKRN